VARGGRPTWPSAYPSRHDLPEYRAYTGLVQRVAREVNEEFRAAGWLPVHLEVRDDYPRSLAAYTLADVLLVNPCATDEPRRQGGTVLSERGVSLVLSRQAGAADELGADAHLVNPYDVGQTAQALHEALSTPAHVRAERSAASHGGDGPAAVRLAAGAGRRAARRLTGHARDRPSARSGRRHLRTLPRCSPSPPCSSCATATASSGCRSRP
jgi:hypothetical protein